MAWTFVGLSELTELRRQYEADLARRAAEVLRLTGLARETASQKITNEGEDWKQFSRAVAEFESLKSDPTSRGPAREGTKTFPGFYPFSAYNFTVIYDCDVAKPATARAVCFYKNSDPDWLERLGFLR